MRFVSGLIPASALLFALATGGAHAMGPVDGEIGAVYWANDFDSKGVASFSSGANAPGFRAELWLFERYGLRAGQYRSDLDDYGTETADYTSLDFMWRAFSPTENNFFALGLGWQEMDLGTIGLSGDTSGARISAEGRVSVAALVYLYAQGSYLPSMDDADAVVAGLGRFEDVSGHEYELGVSWKMAPFVSLRAGYRSNNVEFTQTGLDPLLGFGAEMDGEVESGGFLGGLSLRF